MDLRNSRRVRAPTDDSRGDPILEQTRLSEPSTDAPADGRRRALIEAITPQVDGGRFAAKRIVGDSVVVEADAFADGHDVVVVRLRHRPPGDTAWIELPMEELGNDRWRASFRVDALGRHAYTVAAWTDAWSTWRRDLRKRIDAGQDASVDLLIGAGLVEGAARRATYGGDLSDAAALGRWAAELRAKDADGSRVARALDDGLDRLMATHPDRSHETVHEPVLELVVDPELARFSTWYELFPRSASPDPGRHGTFRDVIAGCPACSARLDGNRLAIVIDPARTPARVPHIRGQA